MAKRKAKTRFVIQAAGKQRELFSARKLSDGTVHLILKHALEHEGETPRKVISQKFSLHTSALSEDGGRLIKQTIQFADGPLTEVGHYKRRGIDGYLAIVFGRLCPDLRHERYLAKPAPRDTIIEIVPYDAGSATLFYFVIAADPPQPLVDFSPLGMNVCEFLTDATQVIILSAFFPAPPIPQGDSVVLGTLKEIAADVGGEFHITSDSLQFTIGLISSLTALLREKLLHRIVTFTFAEGQQLGTEGKELAAKALAMGHFPIPPPYQPVAGEGPQ